MFTPGGGAYGKVDDMEVQEPEKKRKKREVGLEGGSYQQYKRMQESVWRFQKTQSQPRRIFLEISANALVRKVANSLSFIVKLLMTGSLSKCIWIDGNIWNPNIWTTKDISIFKSGHVLLHCTQGLLCSVPQSWCEL